MDDDRIKGSATNVGGKIKESAGKALGDEKTRREGQADQVKGCARNTIGGVKHEARETLDGDRERH
jgi:uncharacterized protein YjbJ (UPF0337 family)